MIRFSHTIFALPFALLAAVMAWVAPVDGDHELKFQWLHLVGIIVCMVGARSAAMAFNRLADRVIDAENPRTTNRHLPSGQLSVGSVVAFTIVSTLVYFGGMLFFLPNWLPLAISVPVLAVLFAQTRRADAEAGEFPGTLHLAKITQDVQTLYHRQHYGNLRCPRIC